MTTAFAEVFPGAPLRGLVSWIGAAHELAPWGVSSPEQIPRTDPGIWQGRNGAITVLNAIPNDMPQRAQEGNGFHFHPAFVEYQHGVVRRVAARLYALRQKRLRSFTGSLASALEVYESKLRFQHLVALLVADVELSHGKSYQARRREAERLAYQVADRTQGSAF